VLVPLDAHIEPISQANDSNKKPLKSQEVPTISVCTVFGDLAIVFSRFSKLISVVGSQ